MSTYQKWCLPIMVNCVCSLKPVMQQRAKIVPLARGKVLEVGVGTGLNLPYYRRSEVLQLWAMDLSKGMIKWAGRQVEQSDFKVHLLRGSAERIPLEDNSMDTIVLMYTLCSIVEVEMAITEMRRVLKDSGTLLFCEHGLAPDKQTRCWQNRLNGIWGRLSGGCHLNRPIPALLEQGGFCLSEMDTMYLPGWKPFCFNYRGIAHA
ncbi:MAG: class I SAM-dependent methyltransferase [Planctomycetota bacterium]|nr:class I SAM-dependent methyltransferase [Planctomycetota bacterium]